MIRRVLMAALLATSALAVPAAARADDSPTIQELTPGAEESIRRGLEYLKDQQDVHTGNVGKSFKVATTSLAGLALLATGDTYSRGRFAPQIQDAVRYLLTSARREVLARPGQFVFEADNEKQGKMHAHGFAMLFLAEVYGSTTKELDAKIQATLRGAVAASLEAQTEKGGWGYYLKTEPEWYGSGPEGEDEASVTVTQVQALRACRNIGIFVPAGAIGRALGYLRRSMTRDGSCRYSLTMGSPAERNRTSFELTAAAVSTLNASGIYIGGGGEHVAELKRGLEFLRKEIRGAIKADKSPWGVATDFPYYGNFYAAQAMFQAETGDWEAWFPPVRQSLVDKQQADGRWEEKRNFGDAYATASALLILQLPRRYLPIFQK